MQAAEKIEQEEVTQKERAIRKLTHNRFDSAEFVTQQWRATIPSSDIVSDLLRPEYFCHVAQKIKPLSIIEAVWEDGSRYCRLIVTDMDKNPSPVWVKVALLDNKELASDTEVPVNETMFSVKYVNHYAKWGVTRLSDNVRLKDKIETEQAAKDWLNEHIKALRK